MQSELENFFKTSSQFKGSSGLVNLPPVMASITLFTTSLTLQGREVRAQLDSTFAKLYHDLDDGFQPINFMLPWFPLPANRRRNRAQRRLTELFGKIIKERKEKLESGRKADSDDMIWNLMDCEYKDGNPIPDHEIAHLMIALLMAGQHSSSVASSWIMLHLAAQPAVLEALYDEQKKVLGGTDVDLTFDNIQQLTLLKYVIQEALRMHPSIHSIMRKVKSPMPIEGTNWVVPPGEVLLASPAAVGKSEQFFKRADVWDPYRWAEMKDPKEMEQEKCDYGYGLVATGADSTVRLPSSLGEALQSSTSSLMQYLPFGAGRHRCIGEQFANLQLTVVVSMMVRYLKLSNVHRKGVVETDYSVGNQGQLEG